MPQCWRLRLVWLAISLAVLGLIARLTYLTIFERHFLLQQSQARILRKVSIPAYRGIIYDRLGVPLAVSTDVKSVWVNPKAFKPTQQQFNRLAKLLHVSRHYLKRKLYHHRHSQFVYLKREIAPPIATQIKLLNISGLFFQTEYRRYYPEGQTMAHVIGFTNIDDQGQEGMELALNPWLSGHKGIEEVLKDRLGHVINKLNLLKKPQQGRNVQLSLDRRIQYLAFNSLQQGIGKFHASSGSAVVLDVQTGEVLAMVNQPAYNPNNRHHVKLAAFRNRAVTDTFEPGSVIKPFTIAFALLSGKYTPDTKIDTDHGWMTIGGYRIRDDLDFGTVTLTELLEKSSNIAAAKILMSLDPSQYWDLLQAVGFGKVTDSGFPGESHGFISPQKTWVPSVIATLAYGYGLSVTTLQLASAYSIIAAHGVKHPVSLLKVEPKAVAGEQVIPQHVADTVLDMLHSVVDKGTGRRAKVPGYEVAGKTGTAYIAGPHGYDHHRYTSSFVGIAPVKHPRLVIAVIVTDPKGKHFGALVAAPIFAKIMAGALRILNVPLF